MCLIGKHLQPYEKAKIARSLLVIFNVLQDSTLAIAYGYQLVYLEDLCGGPIIVVIFVALWGATMFLLMLRDILVAVKKSAQLIAQPQVTSEFSDLY